MRIHLLSDLHNNFTLHHPVLKEDEYDVVVLAGDIGKGSDGIKWARRHYPGTDVVFVPGNHEFYGLDIEDTLDDMRATAIRLGIHLLDDSEVTLQGVRFLGATLWTDFKLFGDKEQDYMMWRGENGLNDYRVINSQGCRFKPVRAIELHHRSVEWLSGALATRADRQVVVTHHLPSMHSVTGRFKRDDLSACFASHRDDLIGHCDLWLHGHTHDSLDYRLGNTRVVCNPRGYQRKGGPPENVLFDPCLVIEL